MSEEVSEKSYWVRSGLFSIFEKGSVFVFGFGAMLILFRYLTQEEMGTWVLFLAITSVIEVSLMGLNMNALIKFSSTAKNKTEYGNIQSAALLLNVLLTLILAILLFFASGYLAHYGKEPMPILEPMLKIYCVTIILVIPFYHCNFTQMANLDFKGVFWSNFTRKGFFFLAMVVLFFIGEKQGLTALAIIQMCGAFVASLVAAGFGKKYVTFAKNLSTKWIETLFHYGKYTFGTNISTMLYKTIDKYMLSGMIGPVATGIYHSAISITNLVDVPSMSVASIVFPQGAIKAEQSGEERKESLRLLYEKSVGAILALILPFILFVFLFPKIVILIVAGEQYFDAIPILRMTILYGIFLPFAIQFGTVLDAMGKPKINFYFTMASAVLNVLFNWIFITKFGTIGAAYGTLLTYFVTFVLFQFVLNNILGVKMYRPFQHIIGFYKQGIQIIKEFITKKSLPSKA